MSSEDFSSTKSQNAHQPDPSPESVEKLKLTGRPGCLAVTVIGTFLILLTIWGGYTLLRQNQLIETFTVLTADPLPELPDPNHHQENWQAFQKQAEVFTDPNQPAPKSLSITRENLEALMATHPGWSDYRDMIRVKSIDESSQSITLDARIPIRRLTISNLMGGSDYRYLVGELKLIPKIRNHLFGLEISEIHVPGKILPPGFLENFRQTDLMHFWYMRPESEAWLKKVNQIKFQKDTLILEINQESS